MSAKELVESILMVIWKTFLGPIFVRIKGSKIEKSKSLKEKKAQLLNSSLLGCSVLMLINLIDNFFT